MAVAVDDIMQDILNLIKDEDIKDFLAMNVEDFVEEVTKRSKEILTPEHIKMAWNYEEKNTKKYSFLESVNWVKSNMPTNIKAAAIYREENGTDNGIIKLHLCFLDEEDNPLLNGGYPHIVINTLELDNELLNNFGDNNLIVLR